MPPVITASKFYSKLTCSMNQVLHIGIYSCLHNRVTTISIFAEGNQVKRGVGFTQLEHCTVGVGEIDSRYLESKMDFKHFGG